MIAALWQVTISFDYEKASAAGIVPLVNGSYPNVVGYGNTPERALEHAHGQLETFAALAEHAEAVR